jgi:hypothetical protein
VIRSVLVSTSYGNTVVGRSVDRGVRMVELK